MTVKNRSEFLESIQYFSNLPQGGYTERLYYCKANIIHPDFSDFIILRSYSSVVAVFEYSTKILWVFGYYSNTTSQHVAKFKNWLRYNCWFESGDFPRRVNLYSDSRTGKRAAKKNIEDDFASVIESALNQH